MFLDVKVTDKQGATLLHYAAKKRETGSQEIIQQVVRYIALEMKRNGVSVNVGDKYEYTALHFAAMRGNEIAAKELITLGAKIMVS